MMICVRLLPGLVVLLLGPAVEAATLQAGSAAVQDVRAAVEAAAPGDTVRIPAGNVAWTSGLNLTRAITLMGAGEGKTVITNRIGDGYASVAQVIRWKPAEDRPLRLSGVTIVSPDWQGWGVVAIGGPASAVRIDHCHFDRGFRVISTNWNPKGTGRVAGVVDHCTFTNPNEAYFVTDVREGERLFGETAWSDPLTPGTANVMVFEDNLIRYDDSYVDQGDGTAFYGCYGGSVVIRHNTLENCPWGGYIDAHGDNPDCGIVLYEVYNNHFKINTLRYFANARGGMHIYHDNVFETTDPRQTATITVLKYWPNDVHVVCNSFYWNNVLIAGGVRKTSQAEQWHVQDSTYASSAEIVEGKSYWLHEPQPGNPFYPYKPLVYPHPLVSGQAAEVPNALANAHATSP